MQVGLHHHREQRLIHPAAALQQRREERPGAELRDPQLQIPGRRGQRPGPVPVAVAGAGVGALRRGHPQRASDRRSTPLGGTRLRSARPSARSRPERQAQASALHAAADRRGAGQRLPRARLPGPHDPPPGPFDEIVRPPPTCSRRKLRCPQPLGPGLEGAPGAGRGPSAARRARSPVGCAAPAGRGGREPAGRCPAAAPGRGTWGVRHPAERCREAPCVLGARGRPVAPGAGGRAAGGPLAEEQAARARRERAEVEERAAQAEQEARERFARAERERSEAEGLRNARGSWRPI